MLSYKKEVDIAKYQALANRFKEEIKQVEADISNVESELSIRLEEFLSSVMPREEGDKEQLAVLERYMEDHAWPFSVAVFMKEAKDNIQKCQKSYDDFMENSKEALSSLGQRDIRGEIEEKKKAIHQLEAKLNLIKIGLLAAKSDGGDVLENRLKVLMSKYHYKGQSNVVSVNVRDEGVSFPDEFITLVQGDSLRAFMMRLQDKDLRNMRKSLLTYKDRCGEDFFAHYERVTRPLIKQMSQTSEEFRRLSYDIGCLISSASSEEKLKKERDNRLSLLEDALAARKDFKKSVVSRLATELSQEINNWASIPKASATEFLEKISQEPLSAPIMESAVKLKNLLFIKSSLMERNDFLNKTAYGLYNLKYSHINQGAVLRRFHSLNEGFEQLSQYRRRVYDDYVYDTSDYDNFFIQGFLIGQIYNTLLEEQNMQGLDASSYRGEANFEQSATPFGNSNSDNSASTLSIFDNFSQDYSPSSTPDYSSSNAWDSSSSTPDYSSSNDSSGSTSNAWDSSSSSDYSSSSYDSSSSSSDNSFSF